MLTVHFTLTRSEALRCNRRIQARRWPTWVVIGFAIVIGVLGLLLPVEEWVWFGFPFAITIAAFAFLIAPALMWQRLPQLRAEQSVSVSDAGVVAKYKDVTTNADWSFFRRSILFDDAYVLQVRRNYVQIPRRAFASAGDEQRFRDLLDRHLGASLSGAPAG